MGARKNLNSTSQTTKFWYNAAGNRVKKQVINHIAIQPAPPGEPPSPDTSSVTYYVRDANEAVMAIYQQTVLHGGGEVGCVRKPNNGGMDIDMDGLVDIGCDKCTNGTPPMGGSSWNPWQEDYDGDQIGDACDPCPFVFGIVCDAQQPGLLAMAESWTGTAVVTKLAELPIYGSERLGLMRPNVLRDTVIDVTRAIFTRRVDQKEYELKDHLGNVRVVVSDMKTRVTGTNFTLIVKSVNNYYAFGMLEEGMSGSSGGYRYGFNGQEMDNEISGVGNLYTAEYWEYDSRLGRRWNVDPKTSPEGSSYRTFSDNPIVYIDPFGDKEYSSLEEFKKANPGQDKLGKYDWLTSDRENQTDVWKNAMSQVTMDQKQNELAAFVQIRDYYKWAKDQIASKGHESRWVKGALYLVDELSDAFDEGITTGNWGVLDQSTINLLKDLNVGIANYAITKFNELLYGEYKDKKLTGYSAYMWDYRFIIQEQARIAFPIYEKASAKALNELNQIVRHEGFIGILIASTSNAYIPSFAYLNGNVNDRQSRYGQAVRIEMPMLMLYPNHIPHSIFNYQDIINKKTNTEIFIFNRDLQNINTIINK